ncbi:putative F-box domain, leucine-rich repeat domain superfamily, F-box-like domain superfamily [Helianthus annuus]|nr:putative F-box domain-containing protein [Helianthus annuus]KAJ0646558.1 putative F-box domain-containing protein [Helianthus annuus]KAJ0837967.1 putative F-box domain, leucine-rich repeat domain superfamily, F-box-like domain superfamily [Helianthus annuus]
MEDRGPPMDMISNLPSNIIQTMLTLMPMRDAFRTSILSRSWKNHYANIPKLKFDDELFQGSAYQTLSIKCILLHIIYPILLLHQGPILEFSLCCYISYYRLSSGCTS